MLTTYIVGNVLGRLVICYVLTFLVCLAFARGDWRQGIARSTRWYSLLGVASLFALGLAASVGPDAGGG